MVFVASAGSSTQRMFMNRHAPPSSPLNTSLLLSRSSSVASSVASPPQTDATGGELSEKHAPVFVLHKQTVEHLLQQQKKNPGGSFHGRFQSRGSQRSRIKRYMRASPAQHRHRRTGNGFSLSVPPSMHSASPSVRGPAPGT